MCACAAQPLVPRGRLQDGPGQARWLCCVKAVPRVGAREGAWPFSRAVYPSEQAQPGKPLPSGGLESTCCRRKKEGWCSRPSSCSGTGSLVLVFPAEGQAGPGRESARRVLPCAPAEIQARECFGSQETRRKGIWIEQEGEPPPAQPEAARFFPDPSPLSLLCANRRGRDKRPTRDTGHPRPQTPVHFR